MRREALDRTAWLAAVGQDPSFAPCALKKCRPHGVALSAGGPRVGDRAQDWRKIDAESSRDGPPDCIRVGSGKPQLRIDPMVGPVVLCRASKGGSDVIVRSRSWGRARPRVTIARRHQVAKLEPDGLEHRVRRATGVTVEERSTGSAIPNCERRALRAVRGARSAPPGAGGPRSRKAMDELGRGQGVPSSARSIVASNSAANSAVSETVRTYAPVNLQRIDRLATNVGRFEGSK